MKIFLYHINSIPKLEDYADRKLICSIKDLKEDENNLTLTIPEEDVDGFVRLRPRICCALRFDFENGKPSQYRYFYLKAFSIKPEEKTVSLKMDVAEIK